MLKIRPVWKADELKRFGELEEKYHDMGETHSGGDTLRLVCSDALHCQHETVRAVARSNGESLVQIKDNQKGLLRNARAVRQGQIPRGL